MVKVGAKKSWIGTNRPLTGVRPGSAATEKTEGGGIHQYLSVEPLEEGIKAYSIGMSEG
jgi:hypothetical protein